VNKWSNIIQSIVMPPVCILCGDRGDNLHPDQPNNNNRATDLCIRCFDELPWHNAACARCAVSLTSFKPTSPRLEALCGHCQTQPPAYDRCQAMLSYQPPGDHLLQKLKFNGRLEMARVLGELMAHWLESVCEQRPDIVIPVPLHQDRLRERGFNQAAELARPIARHLGLPMDIHSCIRMKTTAPQSDLSRKARIKNVKGAFEVVRPVSGHVAIIDDVMTTGSTAHELARTLRQAGATRVEVWICARA